MWKFFSVVVVILCFSIPAPADDAPAVGGEKFVLFKLYDHAKKCTYEVQSESEYKKLKAEIDKERRFFGRAVSLAEREWKADKDNKGSFPRSAASPRDIKEVGTYNDMAAAQAKQTSYQERESKSDDKKKKGGGSAKDKEKAAKAAQRAAERQMVTDGVIALVEGKLKELMNEGGGDEKKAE